MAGLVAMAAGLEDFEATQPCKKSRKDDEPPPAATPKTITNYFMPLPKPVDKPFSPPRSNNIMDYFRKPAASQEKTTSSQKSSPLQSKESHCEEVSPKVSRAPRQKRTRKTKEKQNKLKEEHEEEEKDVLADNCILESPDESLIKEGGSPSVQTNNENGADEEPLKSKNATDTSTDERKAKVQNPKRKNLASQSQTDDNFVNDDDDDDDASAQEDKCRVKRSAVRRNRKANVGQSDTCDTEQDQSLHDASMEVNVDETSMLSCSTVTVSFEEFVQSQMQNQDEVAADAKSETCAVESSETKPCTDASDPVIVAVSPRTLTVQAEVHPISPNHETVKGPQLKVASIFTRNKKDSQLKDSKQPSSDNPQVSTDILPGLKRKSNVVLHEEDLELAVVESSSTPKCTQEERKQFMNAFKQPGLDGSKAKPSKGLSKSKPAKENASETPEPEKKADETDPDPTVLEQDTEQQKAKAFGKKRGRKSVKKDQTDQSEEVPVTPMQEEPPASVEVENKTGLGDDGDKQCVKELRRSTREQTRRQAAPAPERNPSPRKTRSREKAETPAASHQDDVTPASTPKSHRVRKNVYKAEMLYPLNKRESPIRMRFTRVFPSSATKNGDFEILSPLSALNQESNSMRKQAKKLVQKAKALQKSKQSAAGEKPAVRRSTRSKESSQINYCEDEDSVVFLEDVITSSPAPATQDGGNSQKKLRSLNDVLGKNMLPTSKHGSVLVERKSQRPSAIISLLDDSSREGSENSQDDEQFRAKREFLKSGLPESFKKQIAKMAANREAYAQACTSFQSVVHVQQRPMDCSMWTLPWPENPFLSCLKECSNTPSTPFVLLEDCASNYTVPAQRTCRVEGSGRRENFTEPVRERLLEEISISNPSFPVQRFFTRFLKRHQQEYVQAAITEAEGGSKAAPTESIGGKRKRVDEGERAGRLAKKQKSVHKQEDTIVIEDSPGSADGGTPEATDSVVRSSGRRRRSLRNKQGTEDEPKPKEDKKQCDAVIILDSPTSESCAKDCGTEDVPWTEKYQPQQSSDIIGNTASVRKLHSWLKEWKLRADREERTRQQEKKHEDDSNDSWLGGDGNEGMEDAEDMLCNTLLITGPTGVGKTAAVYACAQELGFKVFEVNCSSQRSGRQILSQLKEATQSHQVDIHGVNAHKPTYFNSYSTGSLSTKPGSSPSLSFPLTGKVNSPRRVVSSPRKPPQSPRGATSRKGSLAPKSLANFFKMSGRPTGKGDTSEDKKAQTSCPKSGKVTKADCKSQETKASSEEQSKRTATSLILFEEVDVIFDDDSGFLAAVKTFMTTTKRPVILTTSDPTFSAMFDGYFDEILFKAPSLVDMTSYLQLLCLVENVRTDMQDLSCLLHWNGCDVRQSLLHLQFWTRSGGGRQVPRPFLQTGASEGEIKNEAAKGVANGDVLPPATVPHCHTGCTESSLGLLNTQQEKGVEGLLKGEPSAVDRTIWFNLLSEAERRGVNLLYSNLEVLLPLPIRPLPDPVNRQRLPSNTEPQTGLIARYNNMVEQEEHSDGSSPLKVSCRMRRKKQLNTDTKSALQSDSESEDGFLSLPKPSSDTKPAQDEAAQDPPASKAVKVKVELSDSEKKKSQPVSRCLSSLAEYLDHMSFLDSSLHHEPPQTEGACRPQDFTGAGAEVKCGMTDEVCLEGGGHVNGFDSEEIQAVLGSLSFSKCKARISEAWNKVQELDEPTRKETVEELTLPVASHRQRFGLSHSKLLEPRVMDTRKEVMNTVLTSRSFSTQGNKVATSVDYLPYLRTICRSERLKEQGKVKRRFMHYLDTIHLELPKSTLLHLASDFP
ncbi:ATPase family AAA domain-containing protein 5 isoform X3 [Hemibagrus wyckioides]|uniref:ATPase family AAA domain-containing protein 5 isoform X3 n=1 Tax=Hemibagrus wyckioides TaxID=337641 RepID=UPI00266CA5C4|nr:ATPase family AAA domain-containing protein 5 isoform X3 [Hemibagrus wyckioides]